MNTFYEENELLFEDVVQIDEKMFFSAWNKNGIFSMDLETNELLMHQIVPQKNRWKAREFGSICRNGNSLFFGPCTGECFGEYRILENKMVMHKNPFYIDAMHNSFLITFSYKQYVYFVGAQFPGIIKYDTSKQTWSKIDKWVKEIDERKCEIPGLHYFTRGISIVDGIAYLACSKANCVLALELENDIHKVYWIEGMSTPYEELCYDGYYFWLSPIKKLAPIIKWSPDHNKQSESIYLPADFECGKEDDNIAILPWRIVYANNYIWLIPLAASRQVTQNVIIKISVDTNELEVIKIPTEQGTMKERISAWFVFHLNDSIYFNDVKTKVLYRLNINDSIIEKITPLWNKENYLHFMYRVCFNLDVAEDSNNLWYEAKEDAFSFFIDKISNNDDSDNHPLKKSVIGEKIHQRILEELKSL